MILPSFPLCRCLAVAFLGSGGGLYFPYCQNVPWYGHRPSPRKTQPFRSLRAILGKKLNTLTPPVCPRSCGQSVFSRYSWSKFSYNIQTSAMIRHHTSLRLLLAFLKYPSKTMLASPPWMKPRRRFLWNMFLKPVNDLRMTWQQRQRMQNKTLSSVPVTSGPCA